MICSEGAIDKKNKEYNLDKYIKTNQSCKNLNVSLNLNNISYKLLFKQYFMNISKFSKTITDFAIDNDDNII